MLFIINIYFEKFDSILNYVGMLCLLIVILYICILNLF
jgi:hypothetical protein